MTIHHDLYKYLEVYQVLALDANFAHRKGMLYLAGVSTTADIGRPVHTEITVSYGHEGVAEEPLSQDEKIKLNRIVYGWGPKVHSAAKSEESKPESFSKIKNSIDKDMFHLVPLNVIREVSAVYTANLSHYGEEWKRLPNAKNVFYDSMMRHLEAWQSGESRDPDDGRLHIIKALANLIFVAWHELKEVYNADGR